MYKRDQGKKGIMNKEKEGNDVKKMKGGKKLMILIKYTGQKPKNTLSETSQTLLNLGG